MLLPDLKNNHEGQWMLWNPPGASSVTVATSSAGLGHVHLSYPGSKSLLGAVSCVICVL